MNILRSLVIESLVIVLCLCLFHVGTSFAQSGSTTLRNKYTGQTYRGTYTTSTVKNKYTGQKYNKVSSSYPVRNKYTGQRGTVKTTTIYKTN